MNTALSGLLAITYVFVVVGGIFIHYASTGDVGTLRYSLALPSTLIVIIFGSVIAYGLLRSYAWAWWLGLFAVAVQLIRFIPWLIQRASTGEVPNTSWLICFLLVAFLTTLLTQGIRKACIR